jgi:hypothetical protein
VTLFALKETLANTASPLDGTAGTAKLKFMLMRQ